LLTTPIHGMVLKQVANFYNTIHTQMIASQNGMLVDAAKQFEQLVKTGGANTGKKGVTWDNPVDVEVYIDKLQKSAEKITTENRKLRKIHSNIAAKVGQLLATDLLRNQEKWKEGVREIRGIMDTLEAQGYKSIFIFLLFLYTVL
jgi:dynein heavy chain 2